MPICQSLVITRHGVSTYGIAAEDAPNMPRDVIRIGWDLPDETQIEISEERSAMTFVVSLADLRAWVLQREVDVLARLTPQPPFLMEAPEVANPDAPVSQWERK